MGKPTAKLRLLEIRGETPHCETWIRWINRRNYVVLYRSEAGWKNPYLLAHAASPLARAMEAGALRKVSHPNSVKGSSFMEMPAGHRRTLCSKVLTLTK